MINRTFQHFNCIGDYSLGRKQVANIENVKIVPDNHVYRHAGISEKSGRKVMKRLAEQGEISPLITSTKRRLLSIEDARTLAAAL